MQTQAIFTVDVEDWFHAAVMQRHLSRLPNFVPRHRLAENLSALKDWLEANNAKATFFCLSSLTPEVNTQLRALSDAGHEIASHGHSHTSLNQLSAHKLKDELESSKTMLEQLTGRPVLGFRAPNFSITDDAIAAISAAGYKYDSSVYDVPWHPGYGKLTKEKMGNKPYRLSNGLLELPLSIWKRSGLSIPMAGGAYLRHFPFGLFKRAACQLGQSGYFHFYMHPWEFDQSHPIPPRLGWVDRVRHFRNLSSMPSRITSLSAKMQFTSIAHYIDEHPTT
jgi:polysaccharide deacetylase family protein (PEP-CTERM system associated)